MQLLVVQNGRIRQAMVAPLDTGKIGNAQTISVMLPMIREDVVADLELRRQAEKLIENCSRDDFDCKVGKIFEYAKAVRYDNDPIDVERIADAATTMLEGWGDCGDKVILMTSLLGSIGILTRLVKVNFRNDLETHGYDHIYLEVQRPGGAWEPYDPTPENASPGWEAAAPVRDVQEIWGPGVGGFGGFLDDLLHQGVNTGINLGSQWLGQTVQQSRASGAQATAIGHQYDTLAHQLQQGLLEIQSHPVITVEMITAGAQAYAQVEQYATQYNSIGYVASQWGRDGPGFRTWLEGLAAKVPQAAAAAAAQQQAQQQAAAVANGTAPLTSGLSSSVLSSPYVWILLGVGLLVWMKS